jgi:hypothetical protein
MAGASPRDACGVGAGRVETQVVSETSLEPKTVFVVAFDRQTLELVALERYPTGDAAVPALFRQNDDGKLVMILEAESEAALRARHDLEDIARGLRQSWERAEAERERVDSIIASLPYLERRVLELCGPWTFSPRSTAEAAGEMGLSTTAVSRLWQQGWREVLARLDERHGVEVATGSIAREEIVKELYIDDDATEKEAVAVKEAFARAGFPVTVERGLEGPPKEWGVVFSTTVSLPVFFAAFASAEADDPYAAVKTWAQEIFKARRGPRLQRGAILIHAPQSSVYLYSDMPETAFDSLAEIDFTGPSGYYRWDAGRSEWREASSTRRKWPNWILLGVVTAGLVELRRRRRRAD